MGNDIAYGNQQSDIINGDEGDDIIYGGQENDTVSGGAGNDEIFGNRGDDVLNGGSGEDVFFFHINGGHDQIEDFDPIDDQIAVGGFSGYSSEEWLTLMSTTDTTDGVQLSYGDDFSITITGQTSHTLSADYFVIF
jgi:serralysin